jgi:hypothetical protein
VTMKYSSNSFSSFAGNKGLPVISSYTIHPRDHISTPWSYWFPRTISGAL